MICYLGCNRKPPATTSSRRRARGRRRRWKWQFSIFWVHPVHLRSFCYAATSSDSWPRRLYCRTTSPRRPSCATKQENQHQRQINQPMDSGDFVSSKYCSGGRRLPKKLGRQGPECAIGRQIDFVSSCVACCRPFASYFTILRRLIKNYSQSFPLASRGQQSCHHRSWPPTPPWSAGNS